jgi:hypothetical protein
MLVDRIFTSRFDSLESKRENGYRNPPLYHCNNIHNYQAFRKRRAGRELYEEHPCTIIELIEGALIQSHGLCYFSVYL